MTTTLEKSLPGISHGDHCCLFYTAPEQQARLTAPFLALGLERDERCIYVGSSESVDVVRDGLQSAGVNVAQEVGKERLLLTTEQDYLDEGHWRTEKMFGFLQVAYDEALNRGFSALRAAGDIAWQVGPRQDYEEVAYYEALLDLFFVGKRMVGLCEYPMGRCPPDTLNSVLNAHKIAAVDEEICTNFHYLPPNLLLEKDEAQREEKRVQWMTSQLLRAKKAEDERDALQRQLLHAQKLEAVGRLAGGVAHDFNNLLTVILGNCDLALRKLELDDPLHEHVQVAFRAGESARLLTRQLLAFGRKQILQPRVLDLNDAVRSMDPLLRRLIGEETDLRVTLPADLGAVNLDPSQFEQILLNLAVNARDAMPGGGQLTIETADVNLDDAYAAGHAGVDPGAYVMLAVSDTGSGMDENTQSRIFEPFFTTKHRGNGTGLGLSTVYGLVKQSGGNVWVYSEPGTGTTFKVYLPRTDEVVEQKPVAVDSSPERTSSATILVVEDDDMVRKLIERVLEEEGHTVLATDDVDQAATLCAEHDGAIDLVLTDVVLPKMSGRDLVNRLVAQRPGLKVLYMSGYTESAIVHRGVLDREIAFLQKPMTPTALLQKVGDMLA